VRQVARPAGYQWQPLGLDTDPVPGDPAAISQEAAHLASIARTVNGQIAAMRKIASDNTEVGQHADKIRATALSLAGTLQTVATRYSKVSTALSAWVPELEEAQALSTRALDQAEAPYARLSQAVSLPSGPDLTTAQKQEVADYKASMQRAQAQLDDAMALLTRATTLRDTQGDYYASKISQASNDALTDHDSWFSDVVGFLENPFGYIDDAIRDWAWLLKDVCTVLEVVAAVLAVIALFATGAGWLIAAFALTFAALLGRTALAATGNGSWIDVAWDSVALLTLGLGGGITGAGGLVGRAGATLRDTIAVGDDIVNDARDASMAAKVSSGLTKAADTLKAIAGRLASIRLLEPLASAAGKGSELCTDYADFADDYLDFARPLASAMVHGVDQESALARAASGGEDLGNYAARMDILREAFASEPKMMELAGKFEGQLNEARAVIFSSAGMNLASGGFLPGFPMYGPDGFHWQAWDIGPYTKLDDDMTTPAVPLAKIADDVWKVVDFQWA
jgi:hypothetical protein